MRDREIACSVIARSRPTRSLTGGTTDYRSLGDGTAHVSTHALRFISAPSPTRIAHVRRYRYARSVARPRCIRRWSWLDGSACACATDRAAVVDWLTDSRMVVAAYGGAPLPLLCSFARLLVACLRMPAGAPHKRARAATRLLVLACCLLHAPPAAR